MHDLKGYLLLFCSGFKEQFMFNLKCLFYVIYFTIKSVLKICLLITVFHTSFQNIYFLIRLIILSFAAKNSEYASVHGRKYLSDFSVPLQVRGQKFFGDAFSRAEDVKKFFIPRFEIKKSLPFFALFLDFEIKITQFYCL